MEMDGYPSLNFKIVTTCGTLKNRNEGKPTWNVENEEGMEIEAEIEAEKTEIGVEVECLAEEGRRIVLLGEKLQTIEPTAGRR